MPTWRLVTLVLSSLSCLKGFAQSFPFEADLVLFAICWQLHQSIDELIKTAGRRHVVGFKAADDGIKTR